MLVAFWKLWLKFKIDLSSSKGLGPTAGSHGYRLIEQRPYKVISAKQKLLQRLQYFIQ